MQRSTNARLAGFTFLFYIVAGLTSLSLTGRTHVTDVLSVFTSLSALVLGVSLYAITRDQDADLAMLGLVCRVVEAISGDTSVSATFFAVGSTVFAWLMLRGRMIPASLAWLGVAASVFLLVILLVQRAGLSGSAVNWTSSATWLVWLPMLVFEVALAIWLLIKGVAPAAPGRRTG
jgi:hypothetical protein